MKWNVLGSLGGGFACAAFLVLFGGCSSIHQGKPTFVDKPVRVLTRVVPIPGAQGQIEQDENAVSIRLTRVCGTEERQVVERTTRVEQENETPGWDWFLAGAGLTTAGVGGVVIADADNVYPDDKHSRTYNSVGPDKARAIGIGTVVVGGALITTAIVDGVKASQATEDTQQVTKAPQITRQVACSIPYSNTEVSVKVGEKTYSLGITDAKGQLWTNLDRALDPDVIPPSTGTIPIMAANQEIGAVGVGLLFSNRELRAWRALPMSACEAPTKSDSCAPLEDFVQRFKGGSHVDGVRKVLASVAPRLRELADEEAWAKTDPAGCSKGKKGDSVSSVAAACAPLEMYLKDYPTGAHAEEARAALKKGAERQTAIEEKAAKDQREAEESERREEARRVRAEREAAARAEAKRLAECRSGCRDACLVSRYYGERLDACSRLCVQSRCSTE